MNCVTRSHAGSICPNGEIAIEPTCTHTFPSMLRGIGRSIDGHWMIARARHSSPGVCHRESTSDRVPNDKQVLISREQVRLMEGQFFETTLRISHEQLHTFLNHGPFSYPNDGRDIDPAHLQTSPGPVQGDRCNSGRPRGRGRQKRRTSRQGRL